MNRELLARLLMGGDQLPPLDIGSLGETPTGAVRREPRRRMAARSMSGLPSTPPGQTPPDSTIGAPDAAGGMRAPASPRPRPTPPALEESRQQPQMQPASQVGGSAMSPGPVMAAGPQQMTPNQRVANAFEMMPSPNQPTRPVEVEAFARRQDQMPTQPADRPVRTYDPRAPRRVPTLDQFPPVEGDPGPVGAMSYTPPPPPATSGPAPEGAKNIYGGDAAERLSGRAGGDDLRSGLMNAANELGVDPVDLATVVSYETAGTFDPTIKGPTTQWGTHRGLIQWGEPQAQKYLGGDFSVPSQTRGIVQYMRDAGVEPGMGLLDLYSAVNAGRVGRYNASDANNGGAPGTVRDKVENQMAGHRRKAAALIGADPSMVGGGSTDATLVGGDSGPAPEAQPQPTREGRERQRAAARRMADVLAGTGEAMASGGNATAPTDIRPGQPEVTESQQQGIVRPMRGSEGGGVRQVGMSAPSSPESMQRRRQLAEAMLASGTRPQRIEHPLQGAAQMARAGIGALGTIQANNAADRRQQQLAQALMGGEGGEPNMELLAQLDPETFLQIREQRRAEAMAAQQAMAQRRAALEDYEARKEIDQRYREPPEQWKDITLPDGTPAQRSSRDGQIRIPGGRGSSVTVNNQMGGEDTSQTELMRENIAESMGKTYAQAYEAGQTASQNLARISQLEGLLDGTPGGLANGVLQMASDFGIRVSDYQGPVEAANAVISQMVPQQRPPGSGQMSDADLDLYRRSLPRLMNTPEGNALIIEGMRQLANYQIDHADLIAAFQMGDLTFRELQERQREIANPFGDQWREAISFVTGGE